MTEEKKNLDNERKVGTNSQRRRKNYTTKTKQEAVKQTGTEKVKGNVYAHFTHAAIAMKPYVSNKAKVSKSTSAVGKPPRVYSDDMACGDGEMCEEIFVQTM